MNLIRRANEVWTPQREIQELQDQINRLFSFDYPEAGGLFDRSLNPAVDIYETAASFEVSIDVPGVDRKDLDISITHNVLTIKGEKKSEARQQGRKTYRSESWTGSFQRTLSLPDSLDPDKVQARLRDGVLHLSIAKREELKPRQIAVQVK